MAVDNSFGHSVARGPVPRAVADPKIGELLGARQRPAEPGSRVWPLTLRRRLHEAALPATRPARLERSGTRICFQEDFQVHASPQGPT